MTYIAGDIVVVSISAAADVAKTRCRYESLAIAYTFTRALSFYELHTRQYDGI